MCLLTYFPEGSQPNMDRLMNGSVANPDGDGFAIIANGRIIVQKGLDSDRILEAFEDMRKKYPDGPALFHSRIGTGGSLTEFNCHPFMVGGDERTYLAHNGILPQAAWPYKGDRRSDTHKLAEFYLPKYRFGAVHTPGGRKQLGKWATKGNKFAILTIDPNITDNPAGEGFIINEDAGDWIDGVWYSNNSHDWSSTRYLRGAYGYSGGSNYYSGGSTSKSNGGVTYGDWWKDSSGTYHWTEGTTSSSVTFSHAKTEDTVTVDSDLLGEYDRGSGNPLAEHLDTSRTCEGCQARGMWIEDLPSICGECWTCSSCEGQVDECVCWLSPGQTREDHEAQKANDYVKWWEENADKAGSLAGARGLWDAD